MLNKIILVLGLAADAVKAIREVVREVKRGNEVGAMRAAQRAAEIQAFEAERRLRSRSK